MSNTPITEQSLIAAGYEKRIFFFQIGNYEDEDDIIIFVKDGIAITQGSEERYWHARKLNEISYADGFDTDNTITLRFMEEITMKYD